MAAAAPAQRSTPRAKPPCAHSPSVISSAGCGVEGAPEPLTRRGRPGWTATPGEQHRCAAGGGGVTGGQSGCSVRPLARAGGSRAARVSEIRPRRPVRRRSVNGRAVIKAIQHRFQATTAKRSRRGLGLVRNPPVGTVCFRAGMSAAHFTYSFPLNSEETGSRCAEPTAPSGRLCSLANDDGASFPPSGRRRLSVSGHMVPLLVRDHEGPSVTRTGAPSRGSWPHILATLVPCALLLLLVLTLRADGAPYKLISGQKVGSQTPS